MKRNKPASASRKIHERCSPAGGEALAALGLKSPAQLLDWQGQDPARSTPHRVTWPIAANGFAGFLKRYEPGAGRIGKISRWRAPAEVEWDALQRAAAAGVSVPRPLAAAWSRPGQNAASVLLLEAVSGAERLDHIARSWQKASPEQDLWLAERMLPQLFALHRAGLQHRDLYACHFLRDNSSDQLVLIDLARLRHGLRPRRRIKDLAALAYSLDGLIRHPQLLRLLRLYRDSLLPTHNLHRLAQAITRKAQRIASHRPKW
ncbi:MAG: hypothetical protein CSA62_09720 [Planctomycetota bacterium]|nr:MAG: hypothetical protein CSA62_09720 [Planctomycetota bacterium]